MGDYLRITSIERGKRRLLIERRSADGGLLLNDVSTFQRQKAVRQLAAAFGTTPEVLYAKVDELRRGALEEVTIPLGEASASFSLRLRGLHQPASQARAFPTLAEALECHDYPAPEPLLSWDGRDELAAVDVDFLGAPPSRHEVEMAAELLSPRPTAYWVTHHGGLRAMYKRQAPYTAGELGAVACLALRQRWPQARLELKSDTRHPAYAHSDGANCGRVRLVQPSADVSALARYLSPTAVADNVEIAEWLAARGMEVGGRYDHAHCPINPTPHDPGTSNPVVVYEDAVHCFRCASTGRGRFPFVAVVGKAVPTLVKCAHHFCHWEHAKHLLAVVLPHVSEDISRCFYAACLKHFHGEDARCAEVFTAGKSLLRLEGRWITCGGQELHSRGQALRATLSSLPACKYLEELSGEMRTNPVLVERFSQAVDLSSYGYPALSVIWGVSLCKQWLEAADSQCFPLVLQTRAYQPAAAEPYRPRYLPPAERLEEGAAWAYVDRVLPRVSREAVRLLIAAKGAAESRTSMPPLLIFTGPTGAGKTSAVELAAAICGDSQLDVVWNQSDEKLRAGVITAKEQGSYCCFNEFFKNARSTRRSPVDGLNFLLSLTEDSSSHKLYIGPVRMGALPVCIWTDTAIPEEVRADAQLSRRIIHVHLNNRREWRRSIVDTVGSIRLFRLHSLEHAHACNTILSGVIDEFFAVPMTFAEMALRLGFKPLDQCSEMEWNRALLREFFVHVCRAPGAAMPKQRRHQGWKTIDAHTESDLSKAWRYIRDDVFPHASRRCEETDWQELCGLRFPAQFKSRKQDSSGSRVQVRFQHETADGDFCFNQELLQNESDLDALMEN